MFRIEYEEDSCRARTGKLKLASGTVKTPFFMPVATKAVGKFVDSGDFKDAKTQCIIANSLILDLTIGSKEIERLGGIHKFMNFDRGIFTDSGGFQMYSKDIFVETKKFGVMFKDPRNGKKFLCSPEDSMEIQNSIGSDVAMCLDDMPKYGASKERILDSMKKTYDWALRCKKHHDKIKRKQLLFGICQGGIHNESRKKSAEMITSIDFDGFAFGGLALGEPMKKMFESVAAGIKHMPKEKPRYLMGVGVPAQIVEAVSIGVDCFDSTYPSMTARHNHLLTNKGVIEINKKEYAADENPIEEGCDCYICKSFSRAYMHYLSKIKSPAGYRLRTIHNIRFMSRFMEEIRHAINDRCLKDMKNHYGRIFSSRKSRK